MKISVTMQLPTAWWEVFNQLNKQAEEDAVCHLQLDMEKLLKHKRWKWQTTLSVSQTGPETHSVSMCLFATRRVHWCLQCCWFVRYCWDSGLHEDWRATRLRMFHCEWPGPAELRWVCGDAAASMTGSHQGVITLILDRAPEARNDVTTRWWT